MRGKLVAFGALLVVAGGAGLGYALTRKSAGGMSQQGTQAMGAAIGELDGDIKAARTAVHERANTIASLQPVQGVVATNADTAHDMVQRGELDFNPQRGEIIAIDQVPFVGQPAVILVLPAGAEHTPHTKPGASVEMIGDQVLITETTKVTPRARADELAGYVVVSRLLDLKPAIDRLVAAGVSGRFELDGKTRAIGTPPPGAVDEPTPLPSQPEIQLVVAVPKQSSAPPTPLLAGGGALGVLGLLFVIAGALTRKSAAAAPPAATIGLATTQVSQLGTQPMRSGSAGVTGGRVIGRWDVVRRLGSGGMADVYLARSRGEAGFEKLVAIKVMHPHLARNERAVEHFLDEARIASRITHPNVVAILDLGKIDDDYVIVMEYVDGVDLERLLTSARAAGRQVPVDVGLGILCRICDGLHAANKALAPDGSPLLIVHRDVKSANVLVSKQGGVKVVDFGIAKAAMQSHLTVAGETKGTPSMMAPEQRIGEQVDVRADVYSVAAVGYEILTGVQVNLDLAVLGHLGIENWPHLPPPTERRPQLPPELDRILLGAMSYRRDARPADCAELEAAFQGVMRQYGLAVTDKDIARWISSELAQLGTLATELAPSGVSGPSTV